MLLILLYSISNYLLTSPFRQDRNKFGGGIMVFVREDISSKVVSKDTLSIEGMFIELNICKKKCY